MHHSQMNRDETTKQFQTAEMYVASVSHIRKMCITIANSLMYTLVCKPRLLSVMFLV